MSIYTWILSILDFLLSNPLYILCGVTAYVILYLASVYILLGTKLGENPLVKDYRRTQEPFVHEVKARGAVLKQRFKASLVPEKLDAVIIGSGVGGLSSAVLLSRAGLKVLVLEQHDQAGGCCHSFVDKGFEFDTGIHYIGEMQDGTVDRVLLDQLTCGQLRWAKMDDAFDHIIIGDSARYKLYKMKSGEERYIQNIIDLFPGEKDAIIKYMEMVKDATSSMMWFSMLKILPRWIARFLVSSRLYKLVLKCYRKGYIDMSLQDVLDQMTENQELKAVLSYLCGNYGLRPNNVPFILHAAVANHYKDGAFYPMAGSSEIAFHMIQSIEKAGGKVMMQAPVNKILCDNNNRVIGVQVGKNECEIYAKYIISDAGVMNTFKTLLPEAVAKSSNIYPMISKIGPSVSSLTTFIGLEGSSVDLQLPASNVWLYDTDDMIVSMENYLSLKSNDTEQMKIPFAFISFPSAKDPEWEKKYPGKSSALIITLAKWEWFSKWKDEKVRQRGNNYNEIKDALGRQMWQKCLNLFPHLDGKNVYMEVGTPVSNQYYLACPEGEMYGLQQSKQRFSAEVASILRNDTDIPGLYLTGQDSLTCGFASSALSGLFCASKILNRFLYGELLKLREIIKK